MNKPMLLTICLLGGVAIALLSYRFPRNRPLVCSPINPGPLEELYGGYQKIHGLPLWYYKEEVPANCSISDTSAVDADTSAHFYIYKFVLDALIWTTILLVPAAILQMKRRP